MTNSTSITGSRLKELRLAHNLKTAYLGDLLNVTYRNYLKYEHGTITIDSEKLKFISLLYGVSANWILGLTNSPYDKDMLYKIENNLFDKDSTGNLYLSANISKDEETMSVKIFPANDYIIHPVYKNGTLRSKFGLPIRANIIYICNWIKNLFYQNEDYTDKLDLYFFKIDSDMLEFLINCKFLIKKNELPDFFSNEYTEKYSGDKRQLILNYVESFITHNHLSPIFKLEDYPSNPEP